MKQLLLSLLLFLLLTSMSFRSCTFTRLPPGWGSSVRGVAGGQNDYAGGGTRKAATPSMTPLYYNIFVGSGGSIVRSVTNNNQISYESVASGVTHDLNDVRISNNPYQDDVAVVGDSGTVLISDNSGIDWTIKSPVTGHDLHGVDHSYQLYAVGDSGTILYLNEIITGNLVARTSGTTRNLRAVTISNTDATHAVVVGEKGTILRTTDTGFTWEDVSIPDTTFDLLDLSQKGIYYGTGDVFLAVGSGGRIYKSTDLGATWAQKASGTSQTLRSVYFQTLDSGVVVGDQGTMLFTTDAGESWFTDAAFESPVSRNFAAVAVTNKSFNTFSVVGDSIFIVSDEPVIFTDVKPEHSDVPAKFSLAQNYPNPFNPATTISFSIPSRSHVTLTVFDLSGRKVATVLSGELSPGTYTERWNAAGVASGIYLCRLQAGDLVESRKIVLLR